MLSSLSDRPSGTGATTARQARAMGDLQSAGDDPRNLLDQEAAAPGVGRSGR